MYTITIVLHTFFLDSYCSTAISSRPIVSSPAERLSPKGGCQCNGRSTACEDVLIYDEFTPQLCHHLITTFRICWNAAISFGGRRNWRSGSKAIREVQKCVHGL